MNIKTLVALSAIVASAYNMDMESAETDTLNAAFVALSDIQDEED